MTPIRFPYLVLRAVPDPWRGEGLNYGVVILGETPYVRIEEAGVKRLRALAPNYARWRAEDEQAALSTALAKGASTEEQLQLLELLVADPQPHTGEVVCDADAPLAPQLEEHAEALLARLVRPAAATHAPVRQPKMRRTTRLQVEIRHWLRASKAFSSKVDDVSKGRVVGNYPINPQADMYTDFAVMNGKLHVIETLDLRGAERLTPTLRGDAAVKGITLDEAREKLDGGRRIAVISASDYAVARPAISLIGRFADELWDMNTPGDKQRLAEFISRALHRPQLPELELRSV